MAQLRLSVGGRDLPPDYVTVQISDREGVRSDTLTVQYSANSAVNLARGDVVSASVGDYLFGTYKLDRIERAYLPGTVTYRGHSADLTDKLSKPRSRHWDGASVGQIVKQIAGEHGLKPEIAAPVSGYVYQWIGQQDESDLEFLERLAERHHALFSIKGGRLLWLVRGAGETASGDAIPPYVVALPAIVPGTCRASQSDVDRVKEVRAYWQDRAGAQRRQVTVQADPEATGEHVIREPFATEGEARAAAKAKASEILRGAFEVSCQIIRGGQLMAGQPVLFRGVDPELDSADLIASQVDVTFSKGGGLRTQFSAKMKGEGQ